MKTPKEKTLYRLFVTRFHSKTGWVNKFDKSKKDWRYKRERLCIDRPFTSPGEAKKWVDDQTVTLHGIREEWCELWNEAVPVAETAKCEQMRLEFEAYEEQPLFGEEEDARILEESQRAAHSVHGMIPR